MGKPEIARRERILHAVLDIAVASGFESVTIRSVAEQASVSTGLVLYHFKSRNDLIAAASFHAMQLYRSRVDEIIGEYSGIPRIRAHFGVMYGNTEAIEDAPPWSYWLEYWAHSSRSPEINDGYLGRMEGRRDILGANVANGVEDGDVRRGIDPLLAADLLRAIDAGLPVLLTLEPGIMSQERAHEITELALDLLRPTNEC